MAYSGLLLADQGAPEKGRVSHEEYAQGEEGKDAGPDVAVDPVPQDEQDEEAYTEDSGGQQKRGGEVLGRILSLADPFSGSGAETPIHEYGN